MTQRSLLVLVEAADSVPSTSAALKCASGAVREFLHNLHTTVSSATVQQLLLLLLIVLSLVCE
jgi:hypothetical protein